MEGLLATVVRGSAVRMGVDRSAGSTGGPISAGIARHQSRSRGSVNSDDRCSS